MSEWKPIETAPKDSEKWKTQMLGYSQESGVCIIRYSGWGNGTGPFERLLSNISFDEHNWKEDLSVTHWMPLPEPPSCS